MKLSRRAFLGLGSAGAIAASVGAAQFLSFTTSEIELHEVPILVPDLPDKLRGFRIGFISDLHFGPFLSESSLYQAVQLLKEARPDVILLGGDHIGIPHSGDSLDSLVQRSECCKNLSGSLLIEAIFKEVSSAFATLSPPHGIVTVYGNHDRWLEPDLSRKLFEQQGIPTLINHYHEFTHHGEKVSIYGTDDYWTGVPERPRKFERSNNEREEFRIVLSHNPDYLSTLSTHSTPLDFDLGLAGHTHGGQIRLPLIGAPFYNIRDLRFREGLRSVGNTQYFTTRGVGTVEIPCRINCPPEVAIISLEKHA